MSKSVEANLEPTVRRFWGLWYRIMPVQRTGPFSCGVATDISAFARKVASCEPREITVSTISCGESSRATPPLFLKRREVSSHTVFCKAGVLLVAHPAASIAKRKNPHRYPAMPLNKRLSRQRPRPQRGMFDW